MTQESLSNIVEQSLNSVDLEKLNEVKDGNWKNRIAALFKLASGDYMGAAESALQAILDYKESEFFRKYYRFLYELTDTTPEDRHKFSQELYEKAEDYAGNVIFGMVDRLDNINKEAVLARLSIAKMNGDITIEDFFRLSSLLERIPYVDLKLLPRYHEPYYDESGDTELLYATGALILHTIDANGPNMYVLSTLGEKLLLWGFGIRSEMARENGTNVALNYTSVDVAEGIIDELT